MLVGLAKILTIIIIIIIINIPLRSTAKLRHMRSFKVVILIIPELYAIKLCPILTFGDHGLVCVTMVLSM